MNISKLKNLRNKRKETKYIKNFFLSKLGYVDGFMLDLGCGWGFWTKKLEPNCKFVIGLDTRDIFPRSKLSRKLTFILADGRNLPFRDESFEGVTLFEVLEHAYNDLEFLREINRVLKKEGFLFLSTPNKERLFHQIRKIVGKPVTYPLSLGIDHYTLRDTQEQWHFQEYSDKELVKLLEDTGFEICNIKGIGLGFGKIAIFAFPGFCERFTRTWLVNAVKLR